MDLLQLQKLRSEVGGREIMTYVHEEGGFAQISWCKTVGAKDESTKFAITHTHVFVEISMSKVCINFVLVSKPSQYEQKLLMQKQVDAKVTLATYEK